MSRLLQLLRPNREQLASPRPVDPRQWAEAFKNAAQSGARADDAIGALKRDSRVLPAQFSVGS